MNKRLRASFVIPLLWLALVHLASIGAGFFAPYEYSAQNRSMPFAPPTRLHMIDRQGVFHGTPFVCTWVLRQEQASYLEDCSRWFPIRFFVQGTPYSALGLFESRTHLFGVQEPGRAYLMGTDNYGRDQLSRFLYGGRISLLTGLLACAISLALGLLLGVSAGFYRGWVDDLIMGAAELSLSLPWLYLLFGARALLPLETGPTSTFLMIVGLVGVIGWARIARLVRGTVLSATEREYVLAARGFGASDARILRSHIFPQIRGLIITQAALLIPQYVLAEVTLSFLGLGVNEPAASWGSMLAMLQQYRVMTLYWWTLLPVLLLVPTFLAYLAVARSLARELELA
jgi:peptide/nickel transport system permease protein